MEKKVEDETNRFPIQSAGIDEVISTIKEKADGLKDLFTKDKEEAFKQVQALDLMVHILMDMASYKLRFGSFKQLKLAGAGSTMNETQKKALVNIIEDYYQNIVDYVRQQINAGASISEGAYTDRDIGQALSEFFKTKR